MGTLRTTLQTQLVLRPLLEEPARRWYGLELCELTGLPSGTTYPILARLEQAGWVNSAWEESAGHVEGGRPRRRLYWITKGGEKHAREALARADRSRKRPLPGGPTRVPTGDGTR
ncbi:PadR family transcriptional regulator [Streptomyces sp. NPDC088350]|uniref:PadR family transcriptional regulator n=1 Tax=Streptomyces sp. NPDC088350 TaxID=3365854 RepID=UPI00380DABF3